MYGINLNCCACISLTFVVDGHFFICHCKEISLQGLKAWRMVFNVKESFFFVSGQWLDICRDFIAIFYLVVASIIIVLLKYKAIFCKGNLTTIYIPHIEHFLDNKKLIQKWFFSSKFIHTSKVFLNYNGDPDKYFK